MQRKFGVNGGCIGGVKDDKHGLQILKDAGFDCFFSGCYTPETVCNIKKLGEDVGLELAFLHAPWNEIGSRGERIYMNEFWYENGEYESLMAKVKSSIEGAAAAGVKTVCVHLTEGWQSPPVTDIGTARFDEIVDLAVKRGVQVAFENLFTLGTLAAMMERYERVPEVGFCYDNGHEHCYTETISYLDIYGKRTFCTHIHDNYGRDKIDIWKDADYHLLPFEGNFDYATMMQKLDKYGYEGPLVLEVPQQRGQCADMSPEAYAAHLFSLINRVANAHK